MPILTYNTCTWALTKVEIQKLETFRRQQLRSIINMRYPRRISNEKMYVRCNTGPLQPEICAARWRMLGHVLRMTDDTPAKHTMLHYFNKFQSGEGFRGRPRTTLLVIINQELEMIAEHHNDTAKKLKLPGQLKDLK